VQTPFASDERLVLSHQLGGSLFIAGTDPAQEISEGRFVRHELRAATGFSGFNGFSAISNIQNVKGASGGAAGSSNVLIGNGGNVLTGGDGRRNLLSASATASQLFGGNDDDILIGGTTNWDSDPQWQTAFTAIMAEWTRTDLGYTDRVNHIMNGGGLNDPFLLNPATVFNNDGGNLLQGQRGGAMDRNLFFGLDPAAEMLPDFNADPDMGDLFVNVPPRP